MSLCFKKYVEETKHTFVSDNNPNWKKWGHSHSTYTSREKGYIIHILASYRREVHNSWLILLSPFGAHAPLSKIIEFSTFSKSNFEHLAAHAPLSESPCTLKWAHFQRKWKGFQVQLLNVFNFILGKLSEYSQLKIIEQLIYFFF